MKRILLALTMLGLLLPAIEQLKADDVSFEFFYDNLNDGNWVEVGDYGYCWQPNAAGDSNWRPYADGYWAYTDVGWTWISNEDFGWATYHYGRWAKLADMGWVWIPGTEWGPAWVSWRTGGDQIGWAPLPPARSGEPIYEGRAIGGQVDIEFDIGPLYYNFVDIGFIGEPRLRERIYDPSRNVVFIGNTVNVTNITYTNTTVFNHGPDYSELSQRSSHPIQRLTLQRQINVGARGAFQSNAATKVEGGKLFVAAPMTIKKTPPTVAPKVVKTKIQQPKLEMGWSGVSDPNAKAQMQQKMKAEDATKIPTANPQPTGEATAGRALLPVPTAAPAITPGAMASVAPVHSASPATSPMPTASPMGKGKGRGAQKFEPSATPSGTPVKAKPTPPVAKPVEATTPNPKVSAPAKRAMPDDSKKEQQGMEKTGRPTFSPAKKAASNAPAVAPTMPRQEKVKAPVNEVPAVQGQPKIGKQPKPAVERQAPTPVPAQRKVAPTGGGSQGGGQGKQPTPAPKKPKKGGEPTASPTPGQ